MSKNKHGKVIASQKPLKKRIWECRSYYIMLLPIVAYVIVFEYMPLYGLQIAFKNFKGSLGVWKSEWVGFKHFIDFFSAYNFWQLMRNTVILSLYGFIVSFPFPIIIALMLNELGPRFKRFTQTVLYAPHFISLVVVVGMMTTMLSKNHGVINTILEMIGLERYYFMGEPAAFRHLYVWSGEWQNMGWSSIIYMAALSGVSTELLEAAEIDGATRWQRIIHINLPTIKPTIIILMIMSIGSLISVGTEKVLLMKNSYNVDVANTISLYVYERGIVGGSYSFSAAVGIFNNIVNLMLLFIANTISRKVSETSLF